MIHTFNPWVENEFPQQKGAEIYPVHQRDGPPFSLAELFLVLTLGSILRYVPQTSQNLKLYEGKSFAWVHIHSIGAEQVWSSSIRLLALAWSQSYVTTPLVVDGLELIERRSRSPQLPRFQEKASQSAPKIPRSLTHGPTQLLKSWLKQWRESLKAIS